MLGIFIAAYVSIGTVLACTVLWDRRSRSETPGAQFWMSVAGLWFWPICLILALVKFLNALHVYRIPSKEYMQAVVDQTAKQRRKCE